MIPLKVQAWLTTLYTQPHRHYHNLNHINFCLGQLENVPSLSPTDTGLVELAIWYHDAIYNPYSARNEEESAKLFVHQYTYAWSDREMKNEVSGSISQVEDAILETAHHTHDLIEPPLVTALMMDIDLAGLGQDWEVFSHHGDLIRKEYAHVDDCTFVKNRIKFFESLIKKDSIYYTTFFRNKYESCARYNIGYEIDRLKSF